MPVDQKHVLLIEDEDGFAALAKRLVEEKGDGNYVVHRRSDLASGLEFLEQNVCHAVLLDLFLPDSNGLDTISEVHQRFPEVPIVVLTGLKDEDLARGALAAGAHDFFEKTEVSGRLLKRVLAYAMERNSLKRALASNAANLEEEVRKRTEQLELAGRQWQKTFDAVPDQIAIIDIDHKIIHANKALAQRLGVDQKAIIGASCFELIHDQDSPIDNCPHARLLEDGLEHMLESHEERLGGDFLVSTSPLTGENGDLIGSVHVARDISAMKKAQKALEESEARYRMFLERLPDPTVIYNNDGTVIFSNQAFEHTFGWTLKELQNRQVNFVPAEALEETKARIKQMMGGLPVKNFRTTRLTKAGERLVVRINASPLFDHKGEQTGNIVIMRDITEIVKAEKAARASEERYRMLVESMNEGIGMVDAKARIVYVNKQVARMLSYEPEELIGKRFQDLQDEAGRKQFEQQWRKRQEGEVGSYEMVLRAKDGRMVTTIISPKPLYNKKGAFVGSFALMMDITERKNLEMQLMQAQKLEGIGQLAAGIAHEINTPTQYVSSNSRFLVESFTDLRRLFTAYQELIAQVKEEGHKLEEIARLEALAEELDYDFLTEEIPKALEANQEGLDRIAKIVLSVKQFAHPGTEEMVPTDLNKCIENTITVANNEWKYVAALETDLDPNLPLVPCVAGEINQVILNLIVNAAHAIGDTIAGNETEIGTIHVSTRLNGNYAEMRVSDTGPGIPKKIRSRIFDPFFTTKEPGKGTGQGLAIAYRYIVDHHKGAIDLDSREGAGTTFTIQLPLETSMPDESAE